MGYFINRSLVSKDVYYREYTETSTPDFTAFEDDEITVVSATIPVKHFYFDFEIIKIQYLIAHGTTTTTTKIETDTATEIYFTAGESKEKVLSITEKDNDNKLKLPTSTSPVVLTEYIGQEIQINIVFNKKMSWISNFSSWITLEYNYTSPDFNRDDFKDVGDYFDLIDKVLLSRGFSSSTTKYLRQMKVENGRIFLGREEDFIGYSNVKLYLSKYFFLNKDEEGFQKNNTTPLFEESIDIIRHGDTVTDEQKELVSKYSINIDHFYNVEFEKAYQEPLTAYRDLNGWYISLYEPEYKDSSSFMVDITDMIVRFKTPSVSSADVQSFCARRCKPAFNYFSEKNRFVTSTLNEITTLCDVYDVSSETTIINNFPVRIIWNRSQQEYYLSFGKYDTNLEHSMDDGLGDKQKMEWSFLDKKKVNYSTSFKSSIRIDTSWTQLFHIQNDVKRTYFNPPLSKPKNGEVLTDYLKLNLKDIEVKNTDNYRYNSEKAIWVSNRDYIVTDPDWTKNFALPDKVPYIKINSYTTLKTGKTSNKPATYNYIQKNGWIPIIPSDITSSYSVEDNKFSLKYSFKLDDMALCRDVEEGFLWKIPNEDETINETTTLSQLASYLGFMNSPIYELSETNKPENGVSEFSKTVSNNYLQKINSSSLDAGKTKFVKMSHYVVTDQDKTYQFTLATHPSRQKSLTSDKRSGQFLLDKGFTYNTSTTTNAAYWGASDLIYPEIVFNTTIFPLFFNSIYFSIQSDHDDDWLLIYNNTYENLPITDINGNTCLIDKKYHLDPNDVVVFYIRQQSTTLPTASGNFTTPRNYKKWSGVARDIKSMETTVTINEPTMKVYTLTKRGTVYLESSGVTSKSWKEVTNKKHLFTNIIQKAPAHEEDWYIKQVADYVGSYEGDEWFYAGGFNKNLARTSYLNWTITAQLPVIPYVSPTSIPNPSAVVAYTSKYKENPDSRTYNEDMTAYFWKDSQRKERWVGEISAKFLSGAGILPERIPIMETSDTNRHILLRDGSFFGGGDVTIDDRYFFNNEDYWYTSTFKDTSWTSTTPTTVLDIKQQLINKNYIEHAVAVVIWRNGKIAN